jgi:hypothetical protein
LEAETGKPIVSPTNYLLQLQVKQDQLSASDESAGPKILDF